MGKRDKPTLDNARRFRCIYFIDPEDGEFQETIKNAVRKLEVPMEATMPCKKGTKKSFRFQETEAKSCQSNKIPKQSMHASWRLISSRDNVWNHHNRKIMKITSQV